MTSLIFPHVPKLNTVLGFRPTDEELTAVQQAESATGRSRSDILRACFHLAVKSVVSAMRDERETAMRAFEHALAESPHPYRSGKPPPKHKAG